jgi:NADPH:quinone reductase-like Zn-dependent oxidoreductase
VAGTVEQVGTAVTRFKPGDQVYGDLSNRWGGFIIFFFNHITTASPAPSQERSDEKASGECAMLCGAR